MSRKKKKKDIISIISKVIILCLVIGVGTLTYINYGNKIINKVNSTDNKKSTLKDSNKNKPKEEKKEKNKTTQAEKKEEDNKEEGKKTYTYNDDEGEKVTIKADKSVEATGFAGAGNHKFYLRGTTLYYKNISNDNDEIILAYNVKDLYMENKEVTAELDKDGKIVTENNYITYKNK
ncbi:MAG: hypothetical protein IKF19_01875 [Bacilli bacterium]|nr:hypothetical protein [Bacilli bacterium]